MSDVDKVKSDVISNKGNVDVLNELFEEFIKQIEVIKKELSAKYNQEYVTSHQGIFYRNIKIYIFRFIFQWHLLLIIVKDSILQRLQIGKSKSLHTFSFLRHLVNKKHLVKSFSSKLFCLFS